MLLITRSISLLLTGILLCVDVCSAQIDYKSLYKYISPSVVEVIGLFNDKYYSYGSGFYITQDMIVTNWHVVEGVRVVGFINDSGDVIRSIGLLNKNVSTDLAVFKVSKKGKPLAVLKDKQEVGEQVLALGNPEGLKRTFSPGIISGIRKIKGILFYQTTAPISTGSSGGILVNTKGEVIGITSSYHRGGQNLNFAVSAHYLYNMVALEDLYGPNENIEGPPPKEHNHNVISMPKNVSFNEVCKNCIGKNVAELEDKYLWIDSTSTKQSLSPTNINHIDLGSGCIANETVQIFIDKSNMIDAIIKMVSYDNTCDIQNDPVCINKLKLYLSSQKSYYNALSNSNVADNDHIIFKNFYPNANIELDMEGSGKTLGAVIKCVYLK